MSNLYDTPKTTNHQLFESLLGISQKLQSGDITLEYANKLLMLSLGSYIEDFGELGQLYYAFKFKETDDLLRQLTEYKASLETVNWKIPIIKKCREITGWGLKESKDYVEEKFNE